MLFFQDYRGSLDLACETGRNSEYGWVNWTVGAETPDVVYYQSYNGFGLGWKIRVVNEGDEMRISGAQEGRGCVAVVILGCALGHMAAL